MLKTFDFKKLFTKMASFNRVVALSNRILYLAHAESKETGRHSC